uniref:Uncharacterized protein n=1 Tax=Eptatretus burgeri TaxID=7764 RepID=A0A8C4QG60_EPTBU
MNMGERCNDFFESPFKTCTSNLDTAYTDCRNRLSLIIRWLCEIVKSVRWICNITKVGKIMCLIPSKIKEFLNVKIASPIEKHLQKLKRQFEFNITIDHKFTLNRESSVSVEQVAFKILEDIRHRMETLKILFSFIGDIYFIGPLYLFLKFVTILLLIPNNVIIVIASNNYDMLVFDNSWQNISMPTCNHTCNTIQLIAVCYQHSVVVLWG